MSFRCYECNGVADHAHHVVPRSVGGTRTLPLCKRCHGLVHDRKMVASSSLIRDALAKRKSRGELLGRPAKLPYHEIVERRLAGQTFSEIAKQVGCSKAAVFKICKQYKEPA